MSWKKIIRWALIIFAASVLFHLAEDVIDGARAELAKAKRRSFRKQLGTKRVRHFTPDEIFSQEDK
jgi:hypothetical protein